MNASCLVINESNREQTLNSSYLCKKLQDVGFFVLLAGIRLKYSELRFARMVSPMNE